jgi:hypothetical protein
VALAFAGLGAVAALALAIAGPRSLSGAGFAALLLTIAFRAALLVAGAGAILAVVLDRGWAVVVVLVAAAIFLGYVGGYFIAQGLGLWYRTS